MIGHLEGPAADCVRGFSLTSKNYIEARKLLEERFGNAQVIISAPMNVLLKLPKLNNNKVAKLISFYNAINSNLQSLMAIGLNPSHYGSLFIYFFYLFELYFMFTNIQNIQNIHVKI